MLASAWLTGTLRSCTMTRSDAAGARQGTGAARPKCGPSIARCQLPRGAAFRGFGVVSDRRVSAKHPGPRMAPKRPCAAQPQPTSCPHSRLKTVPAPRGLAYPRVGFAETVARLIAPVPAPAPAFRFNVVGQAGSGQPVLRLSTDRASVGAWVTPAPRRGRPHPCGVVGGVIHAGAHHWTLETGKRL